jgi:hypothetical protein
VDDYLTRFLLEGEKYIANENLAALHFNNWISVRARSRDCLAVTA